MRSIKICDVPVVQATRNEFAKFAIEISRLKQSKISFSLNGESLAKYHYDSDFKNLLLKADYIHADGMSIVKASQFLNKEGLPERIATTDWFHDVASLSEQSCETHYFLGGSQEIINLTISNVKQKYPKLKIVGYRNGYFDSNKLNEITNDINNLSPNFVWLGLGRPKQEKVALKLKNETSVGLIKTCGGLFDFLAGKNTRAPQLMQNLGLEWLYRLSLEPKRLFVRYFTTNIQCLFIFSKFYFKR